MHRRVLVVDDDVRNIFALTTVLENHEMEVVSATNGRQAIEMVETMPDLSVVLMDIMMPEMDGYETMREIRNDPRVQDPADTCPYCKGDEGRPGEVSRGRGVRLHREAGEHRSAALVAEGVVVPVGRRSATKSTISHEFNEFIPNVLFVLMR